MRGTVTDLKTEGKLSVGRVSMRAAVAAFMQPNFAIVGPWCFDFPIGLMEQE